MSDRIDHAAEAWKHIDWAHQQQSDQGEFDFSVRDNAILAQVHATLALVEQQRIANILLMLGSEEPSQIEEKFLAAGIGFDAVRRDIRQGLGLGL